MRGRVSLDASLFSGSNYPFVQHTITASRVIEDMHITWETASQSGLWLTKFNSLFGNSVDIDFVPVHDVDLLLLNDDQTVAIDTREFSYESQSWDQNRFIAIWRADFTEITAVINKANLIDSGFEETRGLLDARVTDYRPTPVTDIRVFSDGEYRSALRSDKSVRFRSGYNNRITSESLTNDRGERASSVELTFEAGAGLGRHPACDTSVGVRSLGGAVPDATGNLLVSGDACLYIRPKLNFSGNVASVAPGQFVFSDGCEAPCSCGDFSDLYNYAKRTWSRYQTIAARANDIRVIYHAIRDYMANVKACAERHPLRIIVWPVRECQFAAAVGLCNPTNVPLRDVVIEFNVQDAGGSDIGSSVVCDSIHRVDYEDSQQMPVPYFFEAPLPTARIRLRCVPPGSMSYVVFKGSVPEAEHGRPIRICGTCPTGVPEPLPTPSPSCGEATLECPEPVNCDLEEP